MSEVELTYRELSETPEVEPVPLAHLSVQVGHVSLDDLADPGRTVARRFDQAAPWLETAVKNVHTRLGRDARISTCLLVDDHTPARSATKPPEPSQVLEFVRAESARAGFQLDYLARDAGCDVACDGPNPGPRDRHPLADIVTGLIVEEAAVGANGSRPPTGLTGWLANGHRSPDFREAMGEPAWVPPVTFGRDRHSVFVDVELWSLEDDDDTRPYGARQYSISLLSAVWRLLRLGLLRESGVAVAVPYRFRQDEPVPDRWSELPSITQLTDSAAPFAAYQALSLLPSEHRDIEHAAGVVLDHVRFDNRVLDLIESRARAEAPPIPLPPTPAGRISHLFLDDFHARA